MPSRWSTSTPTGGQPPPLLVVNLHQSCPHGGQLPLLMPSRWSTYTLPGGQPPLPTGGQPPPLLGVNLNLLLAVNLQPSWWSTSTLPGGQPPTLMMANPPFPPPLPTGQNVQQLLAISEFYKSVMSIM